jgi:hypothetical protein
MLSVGWKSWVNRRVETIAIEDERTALRTVSVDFTLTEGSLFPVMSEDERLVPIAFMRKRPLRRFDLRDEGGKSLTMLTADENSRLGAATLAALVIGYRNKDLPDTERDTSYDHAVPERVRKELVRITRSSPDAALKALEDIRDAPPDADDHERQWRTDIADNKHIRQLANDLARSFPVVVRMPIGIGDRRIVKFSYEGTGLLPEQSPRGHRRRKLLSAFLKSLGLREQTLSYRVRGVGHGGTYHVDVEAPEGLRFVEGRLEARWATRRGEPLTSVKGRSDRERHLNGGRRVHLHLSGVPQDAYGALALRLLPLAYAVALPALLSSVLTAALLAVTAAHLDSIGTNSGSLATVLFFVTGPISAYTARGPREHEMATKSTRGLRMLGLITGLCALGGTMLILFAREWHLGKHGLSPDAMSGCLDVYLYVLAGVAAASAVLAGLATLNAWRSLRRED